MPSCSGAERDPARAAKRRARMRLATPRWVDRDAIQALYDLARWCDKVAGPASVDHVLPLRGKTVSGLHVANNLAVMPADENSLKGNRLLVELA